NTNAMDVIFCRNVLIYMKPDQINRMVSSLGESLVESGWLQVGATETSCVASGDLSATSFAGVTVYRKRTGAGTGALSQRTGTGNSSPSPGTPGEGRGEGPGSMF